MNELTNPRIKNTKRNASEFKTYLPSIIACIALVVVGEVISSGFARFDNIGNIINRASILCIAAIAQLFVVVCGGEGIDLSVGPVMSMSALLIPQLSGGSDGLLLVSVLVAIGLGRASG
jgi:ribose transport system permease protein